MPYDIVDGRVETRALEYHIVEHCNLNCENCCSFSPILPRWTCTLEQFEKDLRKIRVAVRPKTFKIVGGEPLLHPQLTELLKIARTLNLADATSITTNGHLIHKITDEAWGLFDLLTVSIYPSAPIKKETLFYIKDKAKAHGIRMSWKTQDKFVTLDRSSLATFDEAKATFQDCWIHHRCNSVKNGRFYSCTRPQYIQKFAESPEKFFEDGVELNKFSDEELPIKIQEHLRSTEPLKSCFLCRGGNAELKTHQQLDRKMISDKSEVLKAICREI